MSLAGIERRNQQKLQSQKPTNPLFTPLNSTISLGALIILSTSSFMLIFYLLSSMSSFMSSSNVYPTSIPWITDKLECEHTGRDWYDDKCWDDKHSLMF
ncbi:MAG: hypothetical protein RMX96_16445 [Nostoc sp. ChiSLP02]|nr:hypothetical protein [Nostoc sp. DedSLP05]MDZ8186427.1 hypothetical protein [Nostoc sp. ChiSLP02]